MAYILVILQMIALAAIASICFFKPEWFGAEENGSWVIKGIGVLAVIGMISTLLKIIDPF